MSFQSFTGMSVDCALSWFKFLNQMKLKQNCFCRDLISKHSALYMCTVYASGNILAISFFTTKKNDEMFKQTRINNYAKYRLWNIILIPLLYYIFVSQILKCQRCEKYFQQKETQRRPRIDVVLIPDHQLSNHKLR